MRPLSFLLKHTSPLDLARECAWRVRRRVLHARRVAELNRDGCPVAFRNLLYYVPGVPDMPAAARSTILETAGRVRAGYFSVLGYECAHLGLPPLWTADFVTGQTWENDASRFVRHDGSDVRVPWELSRLQYAPVLAKAWRLTGDPAYRTAAIDLISGWVARNPAPRGVNWAIAMEVALRAMSMCFTLNLLWPLTSSEQPWLNTVTRSLWQHLLFIEAHVEFSHIVRGNHYLSDIVGLLCLAHFLHGPGMIRRRRLYLRLVGREMQHQVYPDGGSFEASTGYHVFATQLFDTAWLLMRAAGISPAPRFERRLRKMHEFLAAIADVNGRLPHIGDCDDGRVELTSGDLRRLLLPPGERDALDCGDLVASGAALTPSGTDAPQDDIGWHGLAPSPAVAHRHVPLAVFTDSGLAVARATDAELWFCNLPNGIHGKGSHTHNDKLSFIVRLAGEELFCDSGTACYTRDAALRNRFRSTAAHNTVAIDAAEQNDFSPAPEYLFCLEDQAGVAPIKAQQTDDEIVLASSHSGYQRLGVIHERRIALATAAPHLHIEDRFVGQGEHAFELFFHVPANWTLRPQTASGAVVSCSIAGKAEVTFELSAPVPLQLRSEPAEMSRAYGARVPASRITVGGRAQPPLTVMSRVAWTRPAASPDLSLASAVMTS